MLIRRETTLDREAARSVHEAAFTAPEGGVPAEARLVDDLRRSRSWIPELSLVAERDGAVVGHVLCSRGHVGDRPALGLAPIGVLPEHQRAGVGSALMHSVLGAADALGEPLVALLGDPRYYGRFGFEPARRHGIAPPVAEWEPAFQVRPLSNPDPAAGGVFTYAPAFEAL